MTKLYDEVADDPRLLEAYRAEWVGSGSAEDALWWHDHPEDAAPSGSPSPFSARAALEHRSYTRDGAADSSVRDELTRLDREQRASDAAVVAAVARARAATSCAAGDGRVASSRSRRLRMPAVAGVAGLVLGVGLGIAGMMIASGSAPGGGTSRPPANATQVQLATTTPALAQIFAREQNAGDLPRNSRSFAVDPSSFRLVGVFGHDIERPSVDIVSAYLAKSHGDVCLVVVRGQQSATSCTRAELFADSGLSASLGERSSFFTVSYDSDGVFGFGGTGN